MVHGPAVVGVVGAALLVAMRRVVRAVQVQQDPLRAAARTTLAQGGRDQGTGHQRAGAPIDGVLQARHGGLAGEVRARLRQAPADQLEQGIDAQGVGVVLILVAAGDLEDAARAPASARSGSPGRAATPVRRPRAPDRSPAPPPPPPRPATASPHPRSPAHHRMPPPAAGPARSQTGTSVWHNGAAREAPSDWSGVNTPTITEEPPRRHHTPMNNPG